MLSLGKLAPGQQQYYLDTVAKGAEEYYTGAKEAPGEWHGAASVRLGLSGEVDADKLGAVLAHEHPRTGETLTRSRSHPQVAGFDATFSAPKSVSLLFALGDPETSNQVRNAHDAAVNAALGVLEDHASVGRRGRGGLTEVSGDGFVAAGFRHRTSRAAEPQLHTHVVIANLVHSPADGRWTALDARPLYRWSRPVGFLYEAQLRWELTRRLGVAWGPVHNGIADVAHIPTEAIEAFSTRRRQIVEHLTLHGESGGRAAQIAAYATRAAKDPETTAENLLGAWRIKAKTHGLDDDVLAAALHQQELRNPPAPGSPSAEALFVRLAASDGLTSRRSTFSRAQVLEAICDRLPGGGRVLDIVALGEAFLASDHVIPIVPPRPETDATDAGVERWTTPEMVATEHRLLQLVEAGQSTQAGRTQPQALAAALAQQPTLEAEQEAMVRQICTSGAGIDVVEGIAGSGKTFALAAAHDAWTASGYQVRGACLAARAARRLEEGSGIPSTTLDRLQRRLASNPLGALDVIVVDEAGMVSTRSLLRLVEQAQAARAKVVLVGDPRQLPELEAGGAFAALIERHGHAKLETNRRQSEPWEQDALTHLRHGDPDRAFDQYLGHNRIHHGTENDDTRTQLVSDWHTARTAGADALMVAAHLRAVNDLNDRARKLLQRERQLNPDMVRIGRRAFTVGDVVLALHNDYRLDVLNGTRGIIERIDSKAREIQVLTDDGRRLSIPFDYAAAGDLTHGYATTIHKAQGATVDRCFVLVEETTTREHAYTALSRGREGNSLYVAASKAEGDERHVPEVEPDQLDRLRHSLGRSIRQGLAVDALRPQPDLNAWGRHRRRHRLVGQDSPPAAPLSIQERASQSSFRHRAAPSSRRLGDAWGRRHHKTWTEPFASGTAV